MVQLYDLYSFLRIGDQQSNAVDIDSLNDYTQPPPQHTNNDDDDNDCNDDDDDADDVCKLVLSCDQAMIVGDLNFHQEDESCLIQAPMIDVWKQINPNRSHVESVTY